MPPSLTEIVLPNRPAGASRPVVVTDGEHPGLLIALTAVPDPRDTRGRRYPLVSMLAVAVCAVLAGATTFVAIADWVRDLDRPAWGRLRFTDRLPAATTVWRLLIRIDHEVLSAVLTRWLRARARPVVIAGRRWRLVIAQVPVGDRRSEIGHGRKETRTVKAITAHTRATAKPTSLVPPDEPTTAHTTLSTL